MPAVSTIIAGAGVAVAAGSAALGAVQGAEAAGAKGRAGQAQEAFAREQLDFARQSQAKAEAAAEPSAQELAQLQKQIDVTDRSIARQEELLKAVDPALIEASQQALKLLKGEASSSTQPLERARQRQRQQLENRLREQLGPGFETSSAGIEALGRFDTETADAVQGAQQQALGGITNFLASSSKFRPDVGQMTSMTAIPQSTIADIARRKTAAAIGGLNVAQMGLSQTGAMGSADMAAAYGHEAAASAASGFGKLGGTAAGIGLGMMKGDSGGGLPTASPTGGGPSLGLNYEMPKPSFG